MAIYIYRSTDASAPVLSGSAGALIGVLDACLVNGYGSKAAVGWSKAYSGTNLASYRAPSGNRLYLGVNDTGTNSARIRGFHAMSAAGVDIASGTNPFPTDVQFSGGLYIYKSDAATAASRPWWLISDGKIFYLFVDSYNNNSWLSGYAFGDFPSYKTSDVYNTILIGNNGPSSTANMTMGVLNGQSGLTIVGHYMAQRYDGLVNSVAFGKIPMRGCNNIVGIGYNYSSYPSMIYPDPLTGGMILSPIYIDEVSASSGSYGVLRGRLPGIWSPCHPTPMVTGGTITGTAGTDIAGRTFECVSMFNGSYGYNVLVETSDTWHDVHFR